MRITAEGEQLPWPDVRIVGDMIHVAQSWVCPDAVMSMVPEQGRIYCGPGNHWCGPEDFPYDRNTKRRRPPCKECRRSYQREYDARNREQKRERDREYAARPEVRKRRNEQRRNKERRDRYPVIWLGSICFQAHRLEVLRHRGHLADHEIVHHVDGNPLNHAIENLWVFDSQSDHKRHEMGGTMPPTWRGDQCSCPVCSVERDLRESA